MLQDQLFDFNQEQIYYQQQQIKKRSDEDFLITSCQSNYQQPENIRQQRLNLLKGSSKELFNNKKDQLYLSQQNSLSGSFSNRSVSSRSQLSSRKQKQKKQFNFEEFENILINCLLYFLDFQALSRFGRTSQKSLQVYKLHLQLRINDQMSIFNQYQQFFNEQIQSTIYKRVSLYQQFSINEPNEENALKNLLLIQLIDIHELKQLNNPPSILGELAKPFIYLFDQKFIQKSNEITQVWKQFKKLLENDFYKKLQEFSIETIDNSMLLKLENCILKNEFSDDKSKKQGKPFYHLLKWLEGLIEINRSIRVYSLSSIDYQILEAEEIELFLFLDKMQLTNLRILRYLSKFQNQEQVKFWETKIQEINDQNDLIIQN